jgi:uncharacterized protein DUF1569
VSLEEWQRTPAGGVVIASSEVRSRRRPAASPRGVLAQALAQAERCELDAKSPATGWSLPLALAHCAQAIELSIAGFPRSRSRVFQSVLGRAIKRRFLRRGVMLHNRVAAIPGAPALAPGITRAEALGRLRRAIAAFEAHDGPCAPHFTYGPTTKAEYEALHAMHLTDHLTAFDRPAAA